MKGAEARLGAWKGELPGVELRRHLEQVPGLRLETAHRGILRCGKRRAAVCVEDQESIGIRLSVTAPVRSELQLELPGNLRFAWGPDGPQVIADIHFEPSTLVESFAEVRRGLRQATRRLEKQRRAKQRPGNQKVQLETRSVETSEVQAALEGMGWDEAAIVQRKGGWEARPRMGDFDVPVKVDPTGSGLRVHRTVLDSISGSDDRDQAKEERVATEETLADQALRLNARLRWARLTSSEGGGRVFVAETHLHIGLVTPRGLATACRAVAAAAHHSGPLLSLLAQQREVRRRYFDMFLNNNPPGGE